MRAQKSPRVGAEIVIKVVSREVVWLQVTSYASVKICELEWRRMNGETDEKDGTEDDVLDKDSYKLLLQRDAGWTRDIGAVECIGELQGRVNTCTACCTEHC